MYEIMTNLYKRTLIKEEIMKKYLIISITFVAFIFILGSCSKETKQVSEVNVYEMESSSEVKEDSLITFTEEKVIKQFEKAFSSAKKQSGIVDVADPEYKVELDGKSYFLWLRQDGGTIMNVEDTNTVYSLQEKHAKSINDLLN